MNDSRIIPESVGPYARVGAPGTRTCDALVKETGDRYRRQECRSLLIPNSLPRATAMQSADDGGGWR